MGNGNIAKVLGKGSMELQFTSGKKLILQTVLHVSKIRKNLVSVNLLAKRGPKAVIESDKIVISKNGVFVSKGYSCDGMFKLSINKNIPVSVYIIEQSFSLWQSKLGHVNYKTLQYMSKHGMITCQNEINKKCEVCVQAKMP